MKHFYYMAFLMSFIIMGCYASENMGTAEIHLGFLSDEAESQEGLNAAIRSYDIAYVKLTVEPAGITKILCGSDTESKALDVGDCSFEGANKSGNVFKADVNVDFDNIVVLPEGQQTFIAKAYDKDNNEVGVGSTQATVIANQSIDVFIKIIDSTGAVSGPEHSPIIVGISATKTNPVIDEQIELTVEAVDTDNDTLTYEWTDNCQAGTFTDSTSATTMWSSSSLDACELTVKVSDGKYETTDSISVTVYSNSGGSGSANVEGVFVSHPFIFHVLIGVSGIPQCFIYIDYDYYMEYGAEYRETIDATCANILAPDTVYYISFGAYMENAYDPVYSVTSDCGGELVDLEEIECGESSGACSFQYKWTTPATTEVCTITAKVRTNGMEDEFPIAVLVKPE